MYILFILFLFSLTGIIVMIGRKLAPVRNGEILEQEFSHPLTPDFEKIKDMTSKSTKRYGYLALVSVLRLHIRLTNVLKNIYEQLKIKIQNIVEKNNVNDKMLENKEENKFLKMISDYKHKIRNIKHKIKEEEENL